MTTNTTVPAAVTQVPNQNSLLLTLVSKMKFVRLPNAKAANCPIDAMEKHSIILKMKKYLHAHSSLPYGILHIYQEYHHLHRHPYHLLPEEL